LIFFLQNILINSNSVDPNENNKFYHQIIQKTSNIENQIIDFLNNYYCVALKIIQNYFHKSLNERTELIYFKHIQNLEVSFLF
jgi:hypothetical protein